MRIIAGLYKGRNLKNTASNETRETQDRIKENMFNLLGPINNLVCLDLFAGSGNLGLEALSRGAQICDFNDLSREAYNVIKENIDTLHVKNYNLYNIDYATFLNLKKRTYDLVFLDPPYDLFKDSTFLLQLIPILNKDALVVFETPANFNNLPLDQFFVLKDRKYGSKRIIIYKLSD